MEQKYIIKFRDRYDPKLDNPTTQELDRYVQFILLLYRKGKGNDKSYNKSAIQNSRCLKRRCK